jgi:flagellar motor switch protein FliM
MRDPGSTANELPGDEPGPDGPSGAGDAPAVTAVVGEESDGGGQPDAGDAGRDVAEERLDAAADGQATASAADEPGEGSATRRAEERRIHTVDFSQPTKFANDVRRRILRVLAVFCEAFAGRLTTELRTPVELRVVDSRQLTWSAARAQLPANALAVALDVQPIERSMLLSVDPPLVLQALECLLGGDAAQASADRRLSEIDWALTRTLLEALTAQLGAAWRDLGGLSLQLREIDLEGDGGVRAPLGEATFEVIMETTIDELPSTLSLLIPWSAVAPVAAEIFGTERGAEGADPREQRAVERGLAGARVALRAEVGARSMSVESMLALRPGSLLELPDSAEDGVQVFAERVYIGRAAPGLRGSRRAIKLTSAIEPVRPPELAALTATHARSVLVETDAAESVPAPGAGLARVMGVPVRVWGELGRTQLPLGHALELPPGTVIELDQDADAPIELFVNGKHFADGALQVTGDGCWAVEVRSLR